MTLAALAAGLSAVATGSMTPVAGPAGPPLAQQRQPDGKAEVAITGELKE